MPFRPIARGPLLHVLLLFLLAAGVARAAAADRPQVFDRLRLEGVTVRVDARYLIQARAVDLVLAGRDGKVTEVRCLLEVDRTDLPRLRPPHFDAELDNAAILTFAPDRPVLLDNVLRDGPLAAIQALTATDRSIRPLLSVRDDAGFPLLLDLANYHNLQVFQERGR